MNDGFLKKVERLIQEKKSHICVGLDSDYDRLPEIVKKDASLSDAIFAFNKAIIDKTHDRVIAYKPNVVFYAAHGLEGLDALKRTNEYISNTYSDVVTIADCKRSEMKRSAEMVGKELFESFLFDAFTVTPWFGFDTVEPYLDYKDKAVFILCHDSNPSAGDIQDVELKNGEYLYDHVTKLVADKWNKSGNVLMEAPLTYPEILKRIVGNSGDNQMFLIAGLGAQGGTINDLKMFKEDKNFIVSASRSIIFASEGDDFAQASSDTIDEYMKSINAVIYT